MKVGITGITGRMGNLLLKAVIENQNLELGGGLADVNNTGNGLDIGLFCGVKETGVKITANDNLKEFVNNCDCIIDFTVPELTMDVAKIVAQQGKKIIIGTTGFSNEQIEKLKEYSENCLIIQSGNMSVGVNLLLNLIESASKVLANYDAEILEMHHKNKKDSPSGTALMLGKAVADGRGLDFDKNKKLSREGIVGARPENEIGFATLRGGSVVGEHSVIFAGLDEVIELRHKAYSRQIFVSGAIRAAVWSTGKENGFYNMRDVLNS
ncbi:MAG: 4-hydroxy-tetrahydrodipicolinate reductase [Rickettsiales bacterium]|jgi:4-hydroxy-tetrahydrodipicolinate reductase|nr:4-hydroxy-tetrahydrodipicolinate reductase [Rickettsiales bacterium]